MDQQLLDTPTKQFIAEAISKYGDGVDGLHFNEDFSLFKEMMKEKAALIDQKSELQEKLAPLQVKITKVQDKLNSVTATLQQSIDFDEVSKLSPAKEKLEDDLESLAQVKRNLKSCLDKVEKRIADTDKSIQAGGQHYWRALTHCISRHLGDELGNIFSAIRSAGALYGMSLNDREFAADFIGPCFTEVDNQRESMKEELMAQIDEVVYLSKKP